MALRTEKDRLKVQQEKFQAVLSALLKDDDNKYCEDCDAKGPRWASWNLGIFLCIRCAGIHRNLGVHISKVKSVNLDSWTPEQVAMMQEMGNSRARAVYEANIPDSFRRPQTDSALESFIRAKYEQKKYLAREWVPPKPVVPKEWIEDDRAEKKKARSKPPASISLTGPSGSIASAAPDNRVAARITVTAPTETLATQTQALKPKSGTDDLLGLDTEIAQQTVAVHGSHGDLLTDLFGSTSLPGHGTQQNGPSDPNLFGDGGGNSGTEGQGEKKSTKDSILALYGSGGNQQQMFGVPGGMYMPQQQQQMYGAGMMAQPMAHGMMGPQMGHGMMGMQQQPGAMYGRQMGGMMGQGAMGGQIFMGQQPVLNPGQQQMGFSQVQHQMANLSVGSQMGGMQKQPQQTMVGVGAPWGSVGSTSTGHTLSNNLWQ